MENSGSFKKKIAYDYFMTQQFYWVCILKNWKQSFKEIFVHP